jgi:WD40 repeat protein
MSRKIFLSYGRADDEPFVRQLYERLSVEGFDVWYDRERMPNRGLSFTQEIRDEIDRCERLLLVGGPAALSSAYVAAEWRHALLFGRSVVTVLRLGSIEDLPPELRLTDVANFREPRPFDEAWTGLLRQLQTPPAEWAPLLTPVPALPHPFIARTAEIEALARRVLPDINGPGVVSGAEQATTVPGMPGIGKTVLAAAFARSAQVRRAFRDGIAWVTLGERHLVLEAMRDLLLATTVDREGGPGLDNPAGRDADWSAIRSGLARTLRDRKLLLVVDDAWNATGLDVLRNALGRFCRLVVTTRLGSVTQALQAQESPLDLLSETDALDLLATSSGDNPPPPGVALDLVRECGRLPLALALCGAKLKRGTLAEDLLSQLAQANLAFLSAVLPNYQYSNAYKTIHASIDALERDTADSIKPLQASLYLNLAVFPPDRPLPEAAVIMWWRNRSGKSDPELREILMDLADQALLRLEGKSPARTITLHDLQFDYLRARQSNPKELHRELVDAYRTACSGDWARGPDDGYYLFHLGYHLAAAGLHDELLALLHNFEWLARSLQTGGINRILSDFDLLPSGSGSSLRRALHQSAPVLAGDPRQLPGQLLGRLGESNDPQLGSLLESARNRRGGPWLRPVRASLLTPESPLALVLSGHEGRIRTVACSPDGQILVTAGNSFPDQTVRIWDLERGIELHCLEKQAPEGFTPLAFAHDNKHFLSAVGNEIRVWEWRTGKHVRTVSGHDAPIVALAAARFAPYAASVDTAGSLRFWDMDAWQSSQFASQAQPYFALAFSPDASRLACAGAELLEIFDGSSGDGIRVVPVRETTGWTNHWGAQPPLCFRDDSSVLFWGHPMRYFDFGRNGYSRVDAEEQVLQQPTSIDSRADFALDLFQTFPRLVFFDRERSVTYLVAYGDDEPSPTPSCAVITPDNRRVLICGEDHRVEVWNTDQLLGMRTLRIVGCDQFFFSRDSQYLVVRTRGEFMLMRCDDGRQVNDPELLRAVQAEAANTARREEAGGDGERLLDESEAGVLSTDVPRGKYGEYLEPDVPDGADWPIRFLPSGEGSPAVSLSGHSLPVYAGVLFPEGRTCATAGQGRVIRIWDLPSAKQRFCLHGHTDTIFALAFSPDAARWLLSCSHDRTARVWNLERGTLMATFTADRSLRRAGISPDGRTFVAGQGSAGPLHILQLEPGVVK